MKQKMVLIETIEDFVDVVNVNFATCDRRLARLERKNARLSLITFALAAYIIAKRYKENEKNKGE